MLIESSDQIRNIMKYGDQDCYHKLDCCINLSALIDTFLVNFGSHDDVKAGVATLKLICTKQTSENSMEKLNRAK